MVPKGGRSDESRRVSLPWEKEPWRTALEAEWAAESTRAVRVAGMPALVVALACLGLLVWRWSFEAGSGAVVFAALVLSAVLAASLIVRPMLLGLESARLLTPAAKLCLWMIDRTRERWAEIDGHAVVPVTPGEAFDRAGGRAGDIVASARVRALMWAGDLDGARRVLAGWRPASLEHAARKATLEAELQHLVSGVWNAAAATAAVEAVADPVQRAEARAWLQLESARRVAERGEPTLPAMRGIAAELEPITYSHLLPGEALRSPPRIVVFGSIAVALVWLAAMVDPQGSLVPYGAWLLVPAAAVFELALAVRLRQNPPTADTADVAASGPLPRRFLGQPMVPADDPALQRLFSNELLRLDLAGWLAVVLVFTLFALIAFGSDDVSFGIGIGLLLLIAGPPAFVSGTRWAAGRRFVPAAELACFAYDLERRQWRSIDGIAEAPSSAEEALARLGKLTDGTAVYWRIRALAEEGRVSEATAALQRWRPGGPAAEVSRARLGAWLHEWFLVGDAPNDYRALDTRAVALADPDDRLGETALLALDQARLAARRGEPALAIMAGRRRAMGPLHYETFDGPDDPSRLASRARRFEAFAWAACALALLLVAVGLVLRPDGLIP